MPDVSKACRSSGLSRRNLVMFPATPEEIENATSTKRFTIVRISSKSTRGNEGAVDDDIALIPLQGDAKQGGFRRLWSIRPIAPESTGRRTHPGAQVPRLAAIFFTWRQAFAMRSSHSIMRLRSGMLRTETFERPARRAVAAVVASLPERTGKSVTIARFTAS